MKAKPDLMKLMSVIFQQYPSQIVKEFRQTQANASNRQQRDSRNTQRVRLQMEAYIEEAIARMAGIDIEGLIEEAKAEVAGNTTKKTTKKKVSKRSSSEDNGE